MGDDTKTYKPKLIVFDLDYTLWPFWVDTHVHPPFHLDSGSNTIYDSQNVEIKAYEDSHEVLQQLHSEGYSIGLASRTAEIAAAEELVEMFGWNKLVKCKEIYPGNKSKHFEGFKNAIGCEYHEILFFDDEYRNIVDVGKLGVVCLHVTNGVQKQVVEHGLDTYSTTYQNLHASGKTHLT